MWPARCRHGLKQTPIARIGLALVMVAAALVGATTAARAAPLAGRWVANGHGVRINFVVTRAHGRLIAAHPVAFCGSYGEPVDDEDFRPENLGQLGHQFVADSAPIRRGGRFGDMGTSEVSGRLHARSGRISWKTKFSLDVPPELGGASCPPHAYRRLHAHEVGPVRIQDG
jgi:hypothetical protein